ncbi:hypothetical protein J2S78_000572 [Salibacterium salarium]|nr:hypothetical protein [Salibacterium salarium]
MVLFCDFCPATNINCPELGDDVPNQTLIVPKLNDTVPKPKRSVPITMTG